jgi:hypothetical protein
MNGDRFRVMFVDDAIKAGYLDAWWNRSNEFFYVLLDFLDPLKPVLVATDGGQPEDNTFTRDYAWIAPLLNKLWEEGR